MAAYEVLLLNTAIPQIQAAQSGDTYVVPRDIAFSAALTLSAGTANGVPYLNASKVLTTGSALTFDGTNLGLGTASPSGASGTTFAINGGAGQTRLALKNNNSGDTSSDGFQIALLADGVNVVYQNRESGYQSWELAGSEQMRLTSTGLKASIAGTNADPVFSYTSDTNTGIFFPAADKLGFVAGGGSDQMVLTSTGLGIGTNSPGYKLEVNGAALVNGSTGFLRVAVTGSPTSGDAALQISVNSVNARTLRMENTAPSGRTYDIINGAAGVAGNLGIYDETASAYRVILDSSGNLGLGVTPSAWGGVGGVLEIKGNAYIASASQVLELATNSYFDGANWRYISSSFASRYSTVFGEHRFYTAPSGTAGNAISFTQAMTLDASGRLLVKATSNTGTNTKLAVGSGLTSGNAVAYISTEDVDVDGVAISNWTGSATTNRVSLAFDSSGVGAFRIGMPGGVNAFQIYDTVASTERARISSDGTFRVKGAGTAGTTDAFQVAGTAPADAARIDSTGNLRLGLTSAAYNAERLTVYKAGNAEAAALVNEAGANNYTVAVSNRATTGDNKFMVFATEGSDTTRGSIVYDRGTGLVTYATTSDYRAKDIIGPVTDSGALIDAIPVYMGKMKGATQERPMFIAHEVPAYAHTGEKDAVDADGNPVYQQMDASALIPVMWAEIQSLRQRLAAAGI